MHRKNPLHKLLECQSCPHSQYSSVMRRWYCTKFDTYIRADEDICPDLKEERQEMANLGEQILSINAHILPSILSEIIFNGVKPFLEHKIREVIKRSKVTDNATLAAVITAYVNKMVSSLFEADKERQELDTLKDLMLADIFDMLNTPVEKDTEQG